MTEAHEIAGKLTPASKRAMLRLPVSIRVGDWRVYPSLTSKGLATVKFINGVRHWVTTPLGLEVRKLLEQTHDAD